jgi:hypothetical protein
MKKDILDLARCNEKKKREKERSRERGGEREMTYPTNIIYIKLFMSNDITHQLKPAFMNCIEQQANTPINRHVQTVAIMYIYCRLPKGWYRRGAQGQ